MITLNNIKSVSKHAYQKAKQTAYNITHVAEIDAQKQQIPVCLVHKDKDGMLHQATLSADAINTAHKLAKVIAVGFWTIVPVGMTKAIAENIEYEAKFARELPGRIIKAISQADSASRQSDTIVWDEVIPVDKKFNWVRTSPNTPGGKFYSALKANKQNLMNDLEIDSAKYTMLSNVALKIANEESSMGNGKMYQGYLFVQSTDAGRDATSQARKITEGDGTLSLGLTRMKIDLCSAEEKLLFDKYGITYGNNNSNIDNPKKSAIATIIHLAQLDKGYNEYTEIIKANKLDTTDPKIQKSIKNAQKIIFNNFDGDKLDGSSSTKELALKALTSINNSKEEKRFLKQAGLTQKDLEDLRIYAQTVALSESAWLAAKWNGRRVIPIGDKKDIAVENLINVITQKGYVANIDKGSKIYY